VAFSLSSMVGLTGHGTDGLVLQTRLDRVVAGDGSCIDGGSLLGSHPRFVNGWCHVQPTDRGGKLIFHESD
jgi:hypothetical protein